MRKLRSGERQGTTIKKRADSDGGRTLNVEYKVGTFQDASGKKFDDIRSVNVVLPERMSRLDLWQRDRLRKAVNTSLRKSYSRRSTAPNTGKGKTYTPLTVLPDGSILVGVRRISGSRVPVQVVK